MISMYGGKSIQKVQKKTDVVCLSDLIMTKDYGWGHFKSIQFVYFLDWGYLQDVDSIEVLQLLLTIRNLVLTCLVSTLF